MNVIPYLSFDGRCAEAFRFYETALGGRIVSISTFGESPMRDQTPPEWHHAVVNAHLVLGDHAIMGSDAPPERFQRQQGFAVSLGIDTPEEADRVFAALAEGGTTQMPIQETFWAQRFGMCTDRFGTPWMINCDRPA